MLMNDRKVFKVLVINGWKRFFPYINQGVGRASTLVKIEEDLILINLFSVYVKLVPWLGIPSISPIMPTDCVSSMHENVHQIKLLLSAFYFLQFFIQFFQLLLNLIFLVLNLQFVGKFLFPTLNWWSQMSAFLQFFRKYFKWVHLFL